MDALGEENYVAAAKNFDQVESQHPYSVWATKSQLMQVYALYEGGKFDDAIIAADRFIQLHPGHKDVAYAYYLKAICYYMQIVDVGPGVGGHQLSPVGHSTVIDGCALDAVDELRIPRKFSNQWNFYVARFRELRHADECGGF